jgi:hypothetical protein
MINQHDLITEHYLKFVDYIKLVESQSDLEKSKELAAQASFYGKINLVTTGYRMLMNRSFIQVGERVDLRPIISRHLRTHKTCQATWKWRMASTTC